MAGAGGRPSKGLRHAAKVRLQEDLYERLNAEAQERGLCFSDYAALILAQASGHPWRPDGWTQGSDDTLPGLQMAC